jgi:hypothetical protein
VSSRLWKVTLSLTWSKVFNTHLAWELSSHGTSTLVKRTTSYTLTPRRKQFICSLATHKR